MIDQAGFKPYIWHKPNCLEKKNNKQNCQRTLTFLPHSSQEKARMNCSVIYDLVSIYQVTSLLSILINCDVRGFICSPTCKGPVSVLPQGCQSKVIWGGEPDTPLKSCTGWTQTKAPRERHQRFVGFVLLLSTISQNYTAWEDGHNFTRVDLMILN